MHKNLVALISAFLLLVVAPVSALEGWAVAFERIQVAGGIARSDTNDLAEAGVLEADGFSDLVISVGGEFKEAVPASGRIGVLLIPDEDVFLYLLRTEGQIVFPLEVVLDFQGNSRALFISEQHRFKVAFPRYRVYVYNETTSGANVSVFVYRSR